MPRIIEAFGQLRLSGVVAFWPTERVSATKSNDERGTMNDELKTKAFQFIIHHSSFIVSLCVI
ncbi:MAG: hypothetical protein QOJ02_2465 [Acidobacteriota bacterium]|jgi:hypothetical protein|nr:hypothetical protein [Acidobacteriota bacterium]